jgi:hypothetical protein
MSGINEAMGGVPGRALGSIGKAYIESPVGKGLQGLGGQIAGTPEGQQAYQYAQKPEAAANLGAIGDVAQFAGTFAVPGVGRGVERVAAGAVKGVGRGVESAGERMIAAELKPKQALIKQGYGGNLSEKQKYLMHNISKYKIASPVGNVEKMSDKAITMAESRFAQVEDILKTIAPDKVINPVKTMREAAEEISAPAGWSNNKTVIVNKIIKDMEKRGWDTEMPLDEYIKAKRMLDPDGRLFKEGPGLSDADSFERSIRKSMYLKMVDKISEASPEIKKLNTEAKELLDIKAITDDAAFRRGKNNPLGVSDIIIGTGGVAAGMLGTGIYKPGSIAGAAALIGVKKALGQGRGARMVMGTGRTLQSIGKQINPETATTLSSIGKTK